MKSLWKIPKIREIFIKSSSETAKKTSLRPEILKNRSKVLKNWRDNNPDLFLKIRRKAHEVRSSKPEKILFKIVSSLFPSYNFKHNQFLKNNLFIINETNTRQIDILSKDKKIAIEFDGIVHFKNIEKWQQLELVRRKDLELNEALLKLDYLLIRVSYEQFSYKNGFNEKCIDEIKTIISLNNKGIFKIGNLYNVF